VESDIENVTFITCALRRWKKLRLTGTHRVVYLIGRYAVKRPVLRPWRLFLCGLLANMQEATFSTTGWPQLCPVVFACPGGWLNIMLRAEPLSQDQFITLNYSEWIKGGVNIADGDWVIPVENKKCSFGVLDGRVVAVDYGS
jgi:hypothetical protein